MIRTTAILVAAALGTSILAAAAVQTGQQQRQQSQQQDRTTSQDKDTVTKQGRIVDLYHYMKADENGRNDIESAAYTQRSSGGPVALLVKRDRTILPDTEELYLILCAPEDEGHSPGTRPGQQQPGHQPGQPDRNQPGQHGRDHDRHQTGQTVRNQMFEKAQQMVGQQVRITGKELERNDIQAIVVKDLQPDRGGARPQDRDRDRDRDRTPGR